MKRIEAPFGGLVLAELKIFSDSRGYFLETYRKEWMAELGIKDEFVQENHSRSAPRVLRGLHYQLAPAQGKLISVKRGRIWDVAVDIRRHSPTFGKSYGTELSDENGRMLWIPAGFAHGFCVLGDGPADVGYKTTGYYSPSTEGGVRWDDPSLSINWPVKNPIVSDKDAALPVIRPIDID